MLRRNHKLLAACVPAASGFSELFAMSDRKDTHMSLTAQRLLSVVVTYILSRSLYWLWDFYPAKQLSLVPGIAIEFSIWVAIYFSAMWLLGKMFPPKEVAQTQ